MNRIDRISAILIQLQSKIIVRGDYAAVVEPEALKGKIRSMLSAISLELK